MVSSLSCSPFLRLHVVRLLELNNSNFFSSDHNTRIHCSTDQLRCLKAHSNLYILFTVFNKGFLTHTDPFKPSNGSQSRIREHERLIPIFFSSIFCICRGTSFLLEFTVSRMNLSISSVVFLGRLTGFFEEEKDV